MIKSEEAALACWLHDGTDASFDAVRWAVAEARVVGATVEVVHAWSLPTVGTSVAAGLSDQPCRDADGDHVSRDRHERRPSGG